MGCDTSVNSLRVVIPTAAPGVVLPNNPRRVGIIVSAASVAYSLSMTSNPVLGTAAFNFFASSSWQLVLLREEVGDIITQQMWGIAASALTIEIMEILYSGAK